MRTVTKKLGISRAGRGGRTYLCGQSPLQFAQQQSILLLKERQRTLAAQRRLTLPRPGRREAMVHAQILLRQGDSQRHQSDVYLQREHVRTMPWSPSRCLTTVPTGSPRIAGVVGASALFRFPFVSVGGRLPSAWSPVVGCTHADSPEACAHESAW